MQLFLYILLSYCCFVVPAFGVQEIEVTFFRRNHLGIERADIFGFKEGHYFFDGKNIGSNIPEKAEKSWHYLSQITYKADEHLLCAAGTFSYRIKLPQKELVIRGCTQGAFYAEIVKNVEILKLLAKEKGK